MTGCRRWRATRCNVPRSMARCMSSMTTSGCVPIKPLHKMSESQIKREASVFVLDWDRTVGTLPWQHLVVFRKRG